MELKALFFILAVVIGVATALKQVETVPKTYLKNLDKISDLYAAPHDETVQKKKMKTKLTAEDLKREMVQKKKIKSKLTAEDFKRKVSASKRTLNRRSGRDKSILIGI